MVCGPRMCLILSAIGACEGPAESGPKFSKQSSTGVSTSDMGVWSSTISVGPWVTEVVGRSCRNPALQLLVVPGNPGLSTFYNAFMECLVKRFGPDKVDVMAVSHAGHDSANLSQGQVSGTQDLKERAKQSRVACTGTHRAHCLQFSQAWCGSLLSTSTSNSRLVNMHVSRGQ